MKSPANFETARLDVIDCDGTEFGTFETDPDRGIHGVDEAYLEAIDVTFINDADALRRYEEGGGHKNRTPMEIVEDLAPDASPETKERLTETLVGVKLEILEDQIGKQLSDGACWPRAIPGFLEYSNAVSRAQRNGQKITQAVLSSGHTSFIKKSYRLYGIPEPDILITYETLAGMNSKLSPELLAKPNLFPLKLAIMQWRLLHGIYDPLESIPSGIAERITVIGDSDEKDGGLARNAGARFIKISEGLEIRGWREALAVHGLGLNSLSGAGVNIR